MKPIKHPHLVGLIAILPIMTFFAFGYSLGHIKAATPSTTQSPATGVKVVIPSPPASSGIVKPPTPPSDGSIKPVMISINQTSDDGRPEVLKFTCSKVAVESTGQTKPVPPPTGDKRSDFIVGPGGTNPCGNGRCESGETLSNCPGDCKQLVNPKLNTIR